VTLELRGRILEIKGRKVTVSVTLSAEGAICAKGEEILVQIQDK
jgi:acyl-CoA thioesterase FadM